jgi:molybdopterin synthase catalytic subunit
LAYVIFLVKKKKHEGFDFLEAVFKLLKQTAPIKKSQYLE